MNEGKTFENLTDESREHFQEAADILTRDEAALKNRIRILIAERMAAAKDGDERNFKILNKRINTLYQRLEQLSKKF